MAETPVIIWTFIHPFKSNKPSTPVHTHFRHQRVETETHHMHINLLLYPVSQKSYNSYSNNKGSQMWTRCTCYTNN